MLHGEMDMGRWLMHDIFKIRRPTLVLAHTSTTKTINNYIKYCSNLNDFRAPTSNPNFAVFPRDTKAAKFRDSTSGHTFKHVGHSHIFPSV